VRIIDESSDGRLYNFQYRVPLTNGYRTGWALKKHFVPVEQWKESRL
jgi:hypothetical protein